MDKSDLEFFDVLTETDAADVVSIETQGWHLKPESMRWTAREFANAIFLGCHAVIVKKKGKPVGFAVFREDYEKGVHGIMVFNISVSTAYRRLGVGSAIVDYMKNKMRPPSIFICGYSGDHEIADKFFSACGLKKNPNKKTHEGNDVVLFELERV